MFDDASAVSLALSAYARGYARGRARVRDVHDYVEVLTWIGEYVAAYEDEYGADAIRWGKQFIENIAGALANEQSRDEMRRGDLTFKTLVKELLAEERGEGTVENEEGL